MLDQTKLNQFKSVLDSKHEWPCDYLFKFIVKKEFLNEARTLLAGYPFSERASEKGSYISISFSIRAQSSDEVIEVYQRVSNIPGIISL